MNVAKSASALDFSDISSGFASDIYPCVGINAHSFLDGQLHPNEPLRFGQAAPLHANGPLRFLQAVLLYANGALRFVQAVQLHANGPLRFALAVHHYKNGALRQHRAAALLVGGWLRSIRFFAAQAAPRVSHFDPQSLMFNPNT